MPVCLLVSIALREGDACRQGDRCPSGMECAWGYCRCTIGKPTKDHIACMDSTDRLLGQSCQDGDECYQKLRESVEKCFLYTL